MEPIFSLSYTSCRADSILPAVKMWLDRADHPETIEVVICVDGNSQDCMEAARAVTGAKVIVQPDPPYNCVRGWNLAATQTTGKVIVNMADDFSPPLHWDTLLLGLNPPGWIDGEYVVHVASGYVEDIPVLSILTRKRYERFGYVFYPSYESMFCDTELGTVAYRDGVVIEAKHLLFEHMHCDCGKRAKDEHDVVHGSKDRWNRGEMLFNYRKQTGFPIDEGPKANVDNPARPSAEIRFAVYIQATKDDFCLYEVCRRMMDEGAKDFFFCVPDEYWSGKVTPMEDIAQVRAIADRITQEGANSHFQVFDVSQYRFPGDSRIAVETRLRNDTLGWIRRSGFQHILVVDGDELWVKGLLDKVKDVVQTSKPTCISAPLIPVVGHPGYPVHQASDRAVVYIDGTTTFRECRSPATEHFLLNNGIVIHFTACRKTLQEVIDKHRASGHYDDPEYDFEGWIKNVLPNLKPGWQGAHMYRRYQIWPLVRNWADEEIEHIPESLRQYLGPAVNMPSPIQHVLQPLAKTPSEERVRQPQARKINDLKIHPFRLNQVEQFIGSPLNPYRK
jgi:hypothetical protein